MVKVIASSLRKGNVVDKDGKLYVILFSENIHPGKGTPVTQLDMRRISDGVKVSERYRTTEQVERAHVEDREHTFLYSDAEGFHFMNPENYDQITVAAGDEGPDGLVLLQAGRPVERRQDHRAAAHFRRHAHRRHDRRRLLRRARQGLSRPLLPHHGETGQRGEAGKGADVVPRHPFGEIA